MINVSVESCSLEHLHSSVPFLLFRMSPIVYFPNYLIAVLLIWRSKSKMVKAVKAQYFRQIAMWVRVSENCRFVSSSNFVFILLLSDIVCPILISPIPGYYMVGLLAKYQTNVALPLVLMTHCVICKCSYVTRHLLKSPSIQWLP